jgi:hypothetical protein
VGLKSLKSLNLTNGYPNKNKNNNKNNKVKSKPLELRSRVKRRGTMPGRALVFFSNLSEFKRHTVYCLFSREHENSARAHLASNSQFANHLLVLGLLITNYCLKTNSGTCMVTHVTHAARIAHACSPR